MNIHMIGNAHIDPVWLWRWQEGFAEIKATFQSALDRLEEYPDFIFNCAAASYYEWVAQNCPEMFEQIKMRVREGRWIVAGGMWVQPDCNIPSGEAFARHMLYSQRFFARHLGVTAKTGYNVDSFGHNGMLPQLLRQGGMDAYVMMRPDIVENPDVPQGAFIWHGVDGSQITTYRIPFSYGSFEGSDEVSAEKWKIDHVISLAKELGSIDMMCFFGVGNHGGGPTIKSMQNIEALRGNMEGVDILYGSVDGYFESISQDQAHAGLPAYNGELQHHASGCYSANARIKKDNRRSEARLLQAETLCVLAHHLLGMSYPDFASAWKNVLFNQFHDILCGCSIKEAYEDAREWHGEALALAAKAQNAAAQRISWAIDTSFGSTPVRSKENDWQVWEANRLGAPYVVFNSHSWPIVMPITICRLIQKLTDAESHSIPFQKVRASRTNGGDKWDSLFLAEVPAMGYRVYRIYMEGEVAAEHSPLRAEGNEIENEKLRLVFDPETGFIEKMINKETGCEVFAGPAAVPLVIEIEHCDTWAHAVFSFREETGRFGNAEIKVLENGPVRARIRVTSRYGHSVLQQDYMLHQNASYVDVQCRLDFQEEYKMLKLAFPIAGKEHVATYEIPGGFMERPLDGLEQPGQRWVDISERNGVAEDGLKRVTPYGMTLVNDCKYAFDVLDGELRMTVANTSAYADHFANTEQSTNRDLYNECQDMGVQTFAYRLVPHGDEWQLAHATRHAAMLNTEPISFFETYHTGPLPTVFEGVHISDNAIVCDACKMAEDGDGYVLRLRECLGREVTADVKGFGMEKEFTFMPREIKTVLYRFGSREVVETDFLEELNF